MEKRHALHERAEESVRVLIELIAKKELDERLRFLMVQDFITKSDSLPPATYYFYLSKVMQSYAPNEIHDIIKDKYENMPSPRKVADVGIVTVIPEELAAVKNSLNIDEKRDEDYYSNGLRFWETNLVQAEDGHELRVVITMVGEARSLPCAIACGRFFRIYDVGTCLLIGIAAGLKGKTRLGDVVVSEMVLDYEGQRMDPTGPKKRPFPYVPELRIRRDFQYFIKANREWQNKFSACFKKLKKQKALVVNLTKVWKPKCDTGVILAGEKLLDDGSLPEMREEYHDKVRAAEMEGSGFARACEEDGIQWLVFRGISDFGEDTSSRVRQRWKLTSALSAATAAVSFLKYAFKKSKEDRF